MNQRDSTPVRRTELTRERLLRAATRVLAMRGYEHTTTVEVAKAAGTSESQVLRYFGSKQAMVESVFDNAWGRFARLFEQPRSGMDPLQKLRQVCRLGVELLEQESALWTIVTLDARHARRKHTGDLLLTPMYFELEKNMITVLDEAYRRGHLVCPPAVAKAMVAGYMIEAIRDYQPGPRRLGQISRSELLRGIDFLFACIARVPNKNGNGTTHVGREPRASSGRPSHRRAG